MQAYLVADILLFIEKDLCDFLPRKMRIFADVNGSNLGEKPQLHVCTVSGLFCGSAKQPTGKRILQHQWRGQRFQAAFSPDEGTLEIPAEDTKREPLALQFCLMQFIRMAIGQLLLRRGGFVLHASAIGVSGCALLFSGYSGAGKSTQARLWEKYAHAEIINHDSPMIVFDGEKFLAYGNPWSGSDDCYKQICAPVRSLIVLEKSSENHFSYLDKKETIKFLLTQSLTRLNDAEDMELLIDAMGKFVQKIPVIRYSCRADESAVSALKDFINKERMFAC